MTEDVNTHTLQAELIRELIKERRSERRWQNFRFFLKCIFIAFIILFFLSEVNLPHFSGDANKGYVALVRLDGLIAPSQEFSAENVVPLLRQAFSDREAKGVVLDINSPGGTPVQAAIIHDAILELKHKFHKKVVVVGEDMMASGAYYVAVAADKIYVNPNSLTGSIGVILKEFGFPDLLKKMGVERRIYASGVNKDRLDAFLPQNPDDVAKIREVVSEIHLNFAKVVETGRAGKLKAPADVLFSGDFWSGQSALKLGLVDNLGNLSDAIKNEFKVSSYKNYSQPQALFKNLLNRFGMTLGLENNTPIQARLY